MTSQSHANSFLVDFHIYYTLFFNELLFCHIELFGLTIIFSFDQMKRMFLVTCIYYAKNSLYRKKSVRVEATVLKGIGFIVNI